MDYAKDEFVARCLHLVQRHVPPRELTILVKEFIADKDRLGDMRALARNDEETLLYNGDDLTIVHVRLSPNVHFPPHNHHMPVIIGLYEGAEHHRIYRIDDGQPTLVGEFSIDTGDVRMLNRDVVHSVCNVADEGYACSVNIYLGDLLRQERNVWSHDGSERRPYSDENYFELAAPCDAAKPFKRPAVC